MLRYAKIAILATVLAAAGTVARAEHEQTKAGWAYDEEAISGTKVSDVKVDADKGMILSSSEDKADQDEGNDKAD
jgi:hypothetical protein